MSYGLRVWSQTGNLVLDFSDRVGRHHSSIFIGNLNPGQQVTINIPGFIADGTWFLARRYTSSGVSAIQITRGSGQVTFRNMTPWAQPGIAYEVFRA